MLGRSLHYWGRRVFISLIIAAAGSLAAGPGAVANEGLARLVRRLERPLGRFLLAETAEGRELASRLGAPAGDLEAMRLRLARDEMRGVVDELELSVRRAESRFRTETGRPVGEIRGSSLSAPERDLLRRLIAEEVRVDTLLLADGAPRLLDSSYARARDLFVRMTGFGGEAGALRYPHGVDPAAHPDWALKFGFESEYAIGESGELLTIYGPGPRFGISRERWLSMPVPERVRWVQEHVAGRPASAQDSGLVRLVDEPGLEFMPERLVLDSTGNLEIVMPPMETLELWFQRVSRINARFGAGSMQATVGLRAEAFHGAGPEAAAAAAEASYRSNLGYLNFIHDFDTITKLEAGAFRFREDPTKEVVRSFNHPWLGPMTRMKQLRLAEMLRENARGALLDAETLRGVRTDGDSFKYIGGTTYRPDLAEGWVVFEVRDAHKNVELLVDKMVRSTFFFQQGRAQFARAAEWEAFDSVAGFDRLPDPVKAMLRRTFPARMETGVEAGTQEALALEVFRNFAYPMRDWSAHLRVLGEGGHGLRAARVAAAQDAYLARLTRIAAELESGAIDARAAGARVQGAAAEFSIDSGLAASFQRWQFRNAFADPRWQRYMGIVLQELGPMRRAFPRTVWEGTLEERLARFAERWAGRARIVDDVRFPFQWRGRRVDARRKVLVISRAGLTSEETGAITRDYLDAVSRGTVSFPVGPAPDHLRARVGDRVVEAYNGAGEDPYRMASGERIEPLVTLDPIEELRLRAYVDNVVTAPRETVGRSDFDGAASGRTAGSLRDNRPVVPGERHNCTSWVCTAPVGSGSGRPLWELVGADLSWEIHTSPAGWSAYLAGGAPADRVPFVVYWTKRELPQALELVRPGGRFSHWIFGSR